MSRRIGIAVSVDAVRAVAVRDGGFHPTERRGRQQHRISLPPRLAVATHQVSGCELPDYPMRGRRWNVGGRRGLVARRSFRVITHKFDNAALRFTPALVIAAVAAHAQT